MRNTFVFILIAAFALDCQDDDNAGPCGKLIDERTTVYRPVDLGGGSGEVEEIFKIVEQPPTYGDHEGDLSEYLLSDLELCPESEASNGEIVLSFVVEKDGSINDTHIWITNLPELIYLPFIEKINNMERWNPGMQRNVAVRVQVNIGIDIIEGVPVLR